MKITRKQLRKLILMEVTREHPGGAQGYEDNQTKMVRRYLIQIGKEELFAAMSKKDIDAMAADLRLMSPSEKKQRDLYDLSLSTEAWLSQRDKADDEDEWVDTSVQGGISQQQYLDNLQRSQPGGWYGDDDED